MTVCRSDHVTAPASAAFYASWTAQASDFIANTCGPVMRFCARGRSASAPPPASWPCPCDPSRYQCAFDMLDI